MRSHNNKLLTEKKNYEDFYYMVADNKRPPPPPDLIGYRKKFLDCNVEFHAVMTTQSKKSLKSIDSQLALTVWRSLNWFMTPGLPFLTWFFGLKNCSGLAGHHQICWDLWKGFLFWKNCWIASFLFCSAPWTTTFQVPLFFVLLWKSLRYWALS